MRSLRTACSALCLLALVACEDSNEDTTCTISVTASGDLASQLPGPKGIACVGQTSYDQDIDVEFATIDLPVDRVGLIIQTITKGATGDFPATLRVFDDAGHAWASDTCTVSVSEHTFDRPEPTGFGDFYQVRGTGSCSAPLADDADGAVTLSAFEFSTSVLWDT